MNRENIIRMAREAGAVVDDRGPVAANVRNLQRFAALVAAEEAKVTSEQEPLARFYGVTSKDELIAALERHILRVQARNSHHE